MNATPKPKPPKSKPARTKPTPHAAPDSHDDDREPTPLELAWQEHVSDDLTLLAGLITRHRERQRRYHKVGHVESVVRHVTELAGIEAVGDLDAVVAAALYHDAIHEPTHPANERASARLARRDLTRLGWAEVRADRVGAMIEATASHTDPPDVDTAVLFDADLAILGADEATYHDYSRAIRAEYGHLDDAEWRTGRADFLHRLLGRNRIFATAAGFERWEATARANLSAEHDALTG